MHWGNQPVGHAFAAALMAFTREDIGAHHPWDLLGGLTFGTAVVVPGGSCVTR